MRLPRATLPLALALGVGLSGSPARAGEPERVFEDGQKKLPPPSTRTKVLLAGLGFTGVFYGGAVGASFLWADDPGASDLLIPVVGPWMKMGQTKLCTEQQKDTGCNDVLQVFGGVLAGVAGLGQAAGLALITEGVFLHTSRGSGTASARRLTLDPTSASYDHLLHVGSVAMTPIPLSDGATFAGLGFVGVF